MIKDNKGSVVHPAIQLVTFRNLENVKVDIQVSIPNFIRPSFEEIHAYFCQKGMPALEAHHFYIVHEARSWRTRSGSPIKRWKAAAYQWIAAAWQMDPLLFDRTVR